MGLVKNCYINWFGKLRVCSLGVLIEWVFFFFFIYIEYNVAKNDLNEKDKKVTEKIQQIAMKKKKLEMVVWVFLVKWQSCNNNITRDV